MKENQFEKIKRLDKNGREYWSSRELAKELDYVDYRNFLTAVNKAKTACENSGEVGKLTFCLQRSTKEHIILPL